MLAPTVSPGRAIPASTAATALQPGPTLPPASAGGGTRQPPRRRGPASRPEPRDRASPAPRPSSRRRSGSAGGRATRRAACESRKGCGNSSRRRRKANDTPRGTRTSDSVPAHCPPLARWHTTTKPPGCADRREPAPDRPRPLESARATPSDRGRRRSPTRSVLHAPRAEARPANTFEIRSDRAPRAAAVCTDPRRRRFSPCRFLRRPAVKQLLIHRPSSKTRPAWPYIPLNPQAAEKFSCFLERFTASEECAAIPVNWGGVCLDASGLASCHRATLRTYVVFW